MGIKQLWQVINKLASTAVQSEGLQHIGGRAAFVDVAVFAHASVRVFGTHTSACENLLTLAQKLREAGASACTLVFDGTPVELKAEELARRRALEALQPEPYCGMGSGMHITDLDTPAHLAKPTSETFAAIRAAAHSSELAACGFLMCMDAEADAEACCAKEAAACDGVVVTSDSDALTFGAPRVLRYLPGTPGFTLVSLQGVLESLGLSFPGFQQWCVMCGSDFCEPIKGVGPMTALKFLRAEQQNDPEAQDLIARVLSKRRALLDAHFVCASAEAFESRYERALHTFQFFRP